MGLSIKRFLRFLTDQTHSSGEIFHNLSDALVRPLLFIWTACFTCLYFFEQQQAISDLVVVHSSVYFGEKTQHFKHAFNFFYTNLASFITVCLTYCLGSGAHYHNVLLLGCNCVPEGHLLVAISEVDGHVPAAFAASFSGKKMLGPSLPELIYLQRPLCSLFFKDW